MERRNGSFTAPLRTPVIIGSAFAIDRNFFHEIGEFDQGMDIIGTENIEISVRVSQKITKIWARIASFCELRFNIIELSIRNRHGCAVAQLKLYRARMSGIYSDGAPIHLKVTKISLKPSTIFDLLKYGWINIKNFSMRKIEVQQI